MTFRSKHSHWTDVPHPTVRGSTAQRWYQARGYSRAVARGALTAEDGGVAATEAAARALEDAGFNIMILPPEMPRVRR